MTSIFSLFAKGSKQADTAPMTNHTQVATSNISYAVAAFSETGPVRTSNEDYVMLENRLHRGGPLLLVLADGMGGHNAGEVASKLACEQITRELLKEELTIDLAASMKMALLAANTAIKFTADQHTEQAGMGTTATVLCIFHQKAAFAHIGDSRLYCSINGVLEQLSTDHTLVNQLFANGEITRAEMRNHNQKNVLLQALGTTSSPQIQTKMLSETHAKAKFFLCSDGVYDVLEDSEIEQLMMMDDPKFVASVIKSLAYSRNASDNFSGLLAFPIETSPLPITKEHVALS